MNHPNLNHLVLYGMNIKETQILYFYEANLTYYALIIWQSFLMKIKVNFAKINISFLVENYYRSMINAHLNFMRMEIIASLFSVLIHHLFFQILRHENLCLQNFHFLLNKIFEWISSFYVKLCF